MSFNHTLRQKIGIFYQSLTSEIIFDSVNVFNIVNLSKHWNGYQISVKNAIDIFWKTKISIYCRLIVNHIHCILYCNLLGLIQVGWMSNSASFQDSLFATTAAVHNPIFQLYIYQYLFSQSHIFCCVAHMIHATRFSSWLTKFVYIYHIVVIVQPSWVYIG